MTTRALTRLLAIAAGLVGIWLLVTLLSRDSGEVGSPAAAEWATLFGALTPTAVTSVAMADSAGTRLLVPGPGDWTIDGFEADSAVVARFWSAMAGATVADVVATNPENHGRMGVAEDSTITVTFETGAGPTVLLIGNVGLAPGTTFVRRPGEDAVYLLQGGLRAHFVRRLSEWREKRILALDTAAIHTVAITTPAESYTIVRADTMWTLGGAATRPGTVRGILEQLAGLRGTDFLFPGDSIYELGPAIRVTALGQAGDTMTVVDLGAGERDRRGTVRGDSVAYRVPSFRIDAIAPPRENVVAPPPS